MQLELLPLDDRAVMVAEPTPTAVTTPFSSTVAIVGSLVLHTIDLSEALSGCMTATRDNPFPTAIETLSSLISIDETCTVHPNSNKTINTDRSEPIHFLNSLKLNINYPFLTVICS
jgi:hypothetical protein